MSAHTEVIVGVRVIGFGDKYLIAAIHKRQADHGTLQTGICFFDIVPRNIFAILLIYLFLAIICSIGLCGDIWHAGKVLNRGYFIPAAFALMLC